MNLVLSLDAGTTGVRAVAFDASGQARFSAYREITQFFPAPGYVEHDANEIAAAAINTLREVAQRVAAAGDTIIALGITNQRETVVAFDRSDSVVAHHALVWQDRRGANQCEQVRHLGVEPRVRELTGLVVDTYFSATKMAWLLDHDVLATARTPALATIDTFLVWRLTGGSRGGHFVAEATNASRTLLMDLATREWSHELSEIFGVPLELLAPICASTGPFGRVDGSLIAELAGVPITAVLGDQQAALFGQACFAPGMIKATYGTGAFVLAHAGDRVPLAPSGLLATLAWDLDAYGGVAFALEGSAFAAGSAVQWLRDDLDLISAAADLEGLATSVPHADGVVFVPAFSGLGSPFWRPDARGALLGLSRASTRAHIARAVVDAQVFQVRAMTDAFAAAGLNLVELRADGGMAAMTSMLALQATASRITVRRAATLESTARGAAGLAGVVSGVWSSVEDFADTWRAESTYEPVESTLVDAQYQRWLDAVERA